MRSDKNRYPHKGRYRPLLLESLAQAPDGQDLSFVDLTGRLLQVLVKPRGHTWMSQVLSLHVSRQFGCGDAATYWPRASLAVTRPEEAP
jgi:hypothetical protein